MMTNPVINPFNFNQQQQAPSLSGFGYQTPSTPTFSTGVNMDFLNANPQGLTPETLSFGYSNPLQPQNTGVTAPTNTDAFGFQGIQPQTTPTGISGSDALNFGLNAFGAYTGYKTNERKLDVLEGNLDLARDKYNKILADDKALTDANARRQAEADAQRAAQGAG